MKWYDMVVIGRMCMRVYTHHMDVHTVTLWLQLFKIVTVRIIVDKERQHTTTVYILYFIHLYIRRSRPVDAHVPVDCFEPTRANTPMLTFLS